MPSKSSLPDWHALQDRLHALRIRNRRILLVEGLFSAATLLCLLVLSLTAVESIFYLSPLIRTILLVTGFGLIIAVLGWRCVWPLKNRVSDQNLARIVDRQFPEYHDRVTVALQLSQQRDGKSGSSSALLDAAVVNTTGSILSLDFNEADQRYRIPRSAKWFGGALTLVLLAIVLYGTPISGALARLSHPMTHFSPPQLTFLNVLPGDIKVKVGGQVTIVAESTGKIPEKAILRFLIDSGTWEILEMRNLTPTSYSYTLREIRESLTYEIEAGDAVSKQYRIHAFAQPALESLHQTYHFPAYTRLEPRKTTNGSDIVALKGTRVELIALATDPKLSEAVIYKKNASKSVIMQVKDGTANGMLTVVDDERYRIFLRNTDGHENSDPPWYQIIALPDRPPSIRILAPGRDTDLTENMLVSFLVSGTDDFGFSSMHLVYSKEPSGEVRRKRIPVDLETTMITQPFVWDLSSENLMPEDIISYRFELYDNDTVSGPNRAVSKTYTLRFPSLEEIYDQIDDSQVQQISGMERLLKEQEETKRRIETLDRSLDQKIREGDAVAEKQELTWEQKKELESVLTGQEQATDELLKAAEAVQQAMEQLGDHDRHSQVLIEKMEQLRKMFQEVATPELLKAMQELQQALKSLDNKKLKESVENFKFEQKDFLKRLERSLAILKRIRTEQQLMAAVRQSQDLVTRQEELREASENTTDQEKELAEKQQRLGQDTGVLQRELENLATSMEEFQAMPSESIRETSKAIERQEITKRMAQISDQLKAGRIQEAIDGQQRMAQSLSNLNQRLQEIQNQLNENQVREISREIRRAMHNLVELSLTQEFLQDRTIDLGGPDTRVSILSEDQKGILRGASLAANSIVGTAQKTFFISPSIGRALGETLSSMQRASDHLAEQKRNEASQEQLLAMKSLNETVLALQQAMENMANANSSSGMMDLMERLQSMARQQTGINDQMNKMMNESSDRTTENQSQISRLAAQQDGVRKSLEQLRREQQNKEGQILGRLEEIEKEMKETVSELQQFQIDPRLINRQNRILSRLLDASRSIRGQNRDEMRRATRGDDLSNQSSPDELPEDLLRFDRILRDDIFRGVREGVYPREYEELIRAYFRSLSNFQVVN